MKWRCPLLIAACVISLCGNMAMAAKSQPAAAISERQIRWRLENLIIPKLEFREAAFREALDFIGREAKRLDREGLGVPIVVRVPPSTPLGETNPTSPGESPTTTGEPPRLLLALERDVVSLTNIPVIEALRYVAGLADLKFRISANGVLVVPRSEPDPMLTRDFKIGVLESPEAMAALKKDCRQFFIIQGAEFHEGAWAKLNRAATRLTVHTSQNQLDLIETILEQESKPKPFKEPPIPGPHVPKVIVKDDSGRLREKMRAITLLDVTLEKVPLREAIERLKVLSARYDAKSARGDRGVNIVLESFDAENPASQQPGIPGLDSVSTPAEPAEPAESGASPGGIETNPTISYSAKEVSLHEAVVAIAILGQYHVEVEPDAVLLTSSPPSMLKTREYLMPPDFDAPVPPEMIRPSRWYSRDARNNQPSAVYNSRTRSLVVRASESSHREIQGKIEKGWREYYAAEKTKTRKRHLPKKAK